MKKEKRSSAKPVPISVAQQTKRIPYSEYRRLTGVVPEGANSEWFARQDTLNLLFEQSPFFHAVLTKMAAIHLRKNRDYSRDGSPFSNFELAAQFANRAVGAKVTTIETMAVLSGVKHARLQNLTVSDHPVNNEAFEDTELDQAIYLMIRLARRMEKESKVYNETDGESFRPED